MSDNYYKTKEGVQEYIALAKDVNGSLLIDQLKKFLPINSTLLEIGTGPGTDWNLLKEDYKVIGSDNSLEFLNHLKTTYPTGQFLHLDAITLSTNSTFEGIYSNKVMQHLNNSEISESIRSQHRITAANGIVCHSFWKGEGSEIFKGLYVQYHTKKSILKYFEKYFKVLLIEEYDEFDKGDSLLFIGKKK